ERERERERERGRERHIEIEALFHVWISCTDPAHPRQALTHTHTHTLTHSHTHTLTHSHTHTLTHSHTHTLTHSHTHTQTGALRVAHNSALMKVLGLCSHTEMSDPNHTSATPRSLHSSACCVCVCVCVGACV